VVSRREEPAEAYVSYIEGSATMHDRIVDAMSRPAGNGMPRRAALLALGGMTIVSVALPGAEAAKKGKKGKKAKARCQRQVAACEALFADACGGNLECEAAFLPCCEPLADCNAGASLACWRGSIR
jgi:hypothetical protein